VRANVMSTSLMKTVKAYMVENNVDTNDPNVLVRADVLQGAVQSLRANKRSLPNLSDTQPTSKRRRISPINFREIEEQIEETADFVRNMSSLWQFGTHS